jgi:Protein of unknown function (DUF1559)
MSIRFQCECGQEIHVQDQRAGARVRCPTCQRESIVSDGTELVTATEPLPPTVSARSLSLDQIKGGKGATKVDRQVWVGIVLGLIVTVLVFVCLGGVLGTRDRDSARMFDANNLRQMALAMEAFEDTYGHLPGSVPVDKFGNPLVGKGKPQLSWRVELLPFLEQQNLYNEFHLDEPWDSPHNQELIPRMPKTYYPIAADLKGERGLTVYRVFTGPHCTFRPGNDKLMHLSDITDGRSNTILIAESADPVIWTKPDEMEYDAEKPIPKLGEYFCGRYQFVTFDGTVRTVPTSFSEKKLREAIAIDDGNGGMIDWRD